MKEKKLGKIIDTSDTLLFDASFLEDYENFRSLNKNKQNLDTNIEKDYFVGEKYTKKEKVTYENLYNNITSTGLRLGDFANLLKMTRVSISNLNQKKNSVPKMLFVVSVLIREMHKAGLDFSSIIDNIELDYKTRKRTSSKQ